MAYRLTPLLLEPVLGTERDSPANSFDCRVLITWGREGGGIGEGVGNIPLTHSTACYLNQYQALFFCWLALMLSVEKRSVYECAMQ